MSSFLRGLWENTFGLLVEDGSLAVGILAALAIVWVASNALGDARRDLAGWLLLVLLVALLLVNLNAAGRTARRKTSS
ncbi:MAG TPA: hypothetical protein VHG53_02565 [Candidatus Limnocylindria bacterium]|nr:hypothetical protein [Candidatus Limnocylindria bacterium]